MTGLLCYTRLPKEEEIYSKKLADSVHLALVKEDGNILPLNHNSGIVYAKATQNEDGTLNAKSLKNPRIFRMEDGCVVILAQRTEADGSADVSAKGKRLLFVTKDLIHYEERLIEEAEAARYEAQAAPSAETAALQQGALPEGAVHGSMIGITEEEARALEIRFTTPVNVQNTVPEQVTASSLAELKAVKALAKYSDGSSLSKRVDWYAEDIDWNVPGLYEVEGRVHQDRFEFPVAWGKADPCVCRWKGKYYFISTNDLDHEHSIYIREADSLPGLVCAQQVKILDAYTYPHLGNLLWAPELHEIDGRLYVFHAGTPQEFFEEQSHVMALKEGGNPMKAADWEMPVRVLKKDGSFLYENSGQGITLDMTEFEAGGRHYVCWSQRQFLPVDQGAWLYIACVDPKKPWQLTTDPVLLSMPEYGWANNHTFVDEAPFALKKDGKVYLTFSSAATDSTYVVGLLSAQEDADLLEPASWTKENYPLLTSLSVEGQFGPGHNSYVTDEEGLVWNVYHARFGVNGPRSAGIRRVHFNAQGFPVLDMTEEMDLDPELAAVKTVVEVPQKGME